MQIKLVVVVGTWQPTSLLRDSSALKHMTLHPIVAKTRSKKRTVITRDMANSDDDRGYLLQEACPFNRTEAHHFENSYSVRDSITSLLSIYRANTAITFPGGGPQTVTKSELASSPFYLQNNI